ncbi:MAG: polysaccharide biosynthesis protein [Bacteroidaceae bacterium]|nr:polysaccharide biosynthesis protein [Bacteroidaceae bacterium]
MSFVQKITDWYFTKRAVPYWCVLIVDCIIVLFSGLVCSYIEIGGLGLTNVWWETVSGMACCMPVYIACFHLFHTYKGIVRYSSYEDFFRLTKATLIASVLVSFIGHFVNCKCLIIPDLKSALIICVISIFLMWVVRLLVKASYESFSINKAIPVAIYGTQAGGLAIANSIRAVREKKYLLQAFITDREERAGIYLLGKKVYLNEAGIAERMQDERVQALLVSPLKSDLFRNNQKMVDEFTCAGIKILIMPEAEEWDGKSDISYQQFKEVEIEDLLPRDKIEVDMKAIGTMLSGKRILITGAAGSIGSEMSRQVAKFNPAELVLVDQAETPMHDVRLYMANNHKDLKVWTIVGSITNQEQMEHIFSEHKPEYVFHAAAYKHVPMMEDNPAMAVQNNIYGTRVIADLAVKYETKKFVMISTDKAVNPTNVMGCSKRICEIYCQALNNKLWEETQRTGKPTTQFITTRFGNVLGSNGSVIPIFREQIRKGGPVMVTHPDIIRYFMLIPEACKLVLEAGTMGKGGEIFVFDMGEPVKIVDLAKRMIKLSGAKNIEIQFSGLRDGEKLYEEVLNDAEQTKPTVNPKIKVASVREYPYELAQKNEEELLSLSCSFNDMSIVKKMKEIVPEYKSQHSKYQELDNLNLKRIDNN